MQALVMLVFPPISWLPISILFLPPAPDPCVSCDCQKYLTWVWRLKSWAGGILPPWCPRHTAMTRICIAGTLQCQPLATLQVNLQTPGLIAWGPSSSTRGRYSLALCPGCLKVVYRSDLNFLTLSRGLRRSRNVGRIRASEHLGQTETKTAPDEKFPASTELQPTQPGIKKIPPKVAPKPRHHSKIINELLTNHLSLLWIAIIVWMNDLRKYVTDILISSDSQQYLSLDCLTSRYWPMMTRTSMT